MKEKKWSDVSSDDCYNSRKVMRGERSAIC